MFTADAVKRVKTILGFRKNLDQDILEAMQEVQRELEQDPELPWFLRKSSELVCAPGQNGVNAPTGFLREWEEDQMSVSQPVADGGAFIQNVVKESIGYMRVRWAEQTGAPVNYAYLFSGGKTNLAGEFIFYPLPDKAYLLDHTAYFADTLLDLFDPGTGAPLTNIWMTKLPEIFIARSGLIISAALRDQNALTFFNALNQTATQKLHQATVGYDAVGAKPVMGGMED